jgi:gas vesicle protein
MANDEGAGSGLVMLAFLVGAAAGAALALLYAPATGRETRELIGEKSREGREKAMALAEKGKQVINEGREKAAALAEKGKQVINDGRETLTTAIERGREAYEQARARENA